MNNIKSALTAGIRNADGQIEVNDTNKVFIPGLVMACKKSSTTQDYDLTRFAGELIAQGIAPAGFALWVEMNSLSLIQKFFMGYFVEGNVDKFPSVDVQSGENGQERTPLFTNAVGYMDTPGKSWQRVRAALAYGQEGSDDVGKWAKDDYGFFNRGVASLIKQDMWALDAKSTEIKDGEDKIGDTFVIPAAGNRGEMTVQVIYRGYGRKNLVQLLS